MLAGFPHPYVKVSIGNTLGTFSRLLICNSLLRAVALLVDSFVPTSYFVSIIRPLAVRLTSVLNPGRRS